MKICPVVLSISSDEGDNLVKFTWGDGDILFSGVEPRIKFDVEDIKDDGATGASSIGIEDIDDGAT